MMKRNPNMPPVGTAALIGTLISMAEIPTEELPEGSAAKRIRAKEVARLPHQGKREMERRRKRMKEMTND